MLSTATLPKTLGASRTRTNPFTDVYHRRMNNPHDTPDSAHTLIKHRNNPHQTLLHRKHVCATSPIDTTSEVFACTQRKGMRQSTKYSQVGHTINHELKHGQQTISKPPTKT